MPPRGSHALVKEQGKHAFLRACIFLFALGLLLAFPGCRSSGLRGGLLVTFDVAGERYSVLVKNPQAIEQVLAVSRGESQAAIPNGRLVKGRVQYNTPWDWHIDSQDFVISEISVELYDGLPSHVQNDLDYWVLSVGRYAPWQAKMVKVEDFR